MKTCSKCGEAKPLDAYYMEKGKPRASCKDCHKKKVYAHREADPDAFNAERRAYYNQNRERIRDYQRRYLAEHSDEINERRRLDRQQNPEKYLSVSRASWDRHKVRINAERRAFYAENRETIRARENQRYADDPRPYLEWAARYREENREAINERQREYYKVNPDLYAKHRRLRRARLAGVESDDYTRREIFERDEGQCRDCRKKLVYEPNGFQIDHIVPISLGGPDIRANVQLMCQTCNRKKWANLEGQIHLPL
jgi:5-methylcytosine-specific restriction endonuclease McrA